MKSKLLSASWSAGTRHIIECACASPTHLLIFDFYKDDTSIDVYFTSNWHLSFWGRLKAAILFICKKENYNMTDTVLIQESNIKELEVMIRDIKKSISTMRANK